MPESRYHDAGSDGGGRAWATIATLLTTAKINGVDLITKIVNAHPNAQIDELLPWAYPASPILSRVA